MYSTRIACCRGTEATSIRNREGISVGLRKGSVQQPSNVAQAAKQANLSPTVPSGIRTQNVSLQNNNQHNLTKRESCRTCLQGSCKLVEITHDSQVDTCTTRQSPKHKLQATIRKWQVHTVMAAPTEQAPTRNRGRISGVN